MLREESRRFVASQEVPARGGHMSEGVWVNSGQKQGLHSVCQEGGVFLPYMAQGYLLRSSQENSFGVMLLFS